MRHVPLLTTATLCSLCLGGLLLTCRAECIDIRTPYCKKAVNCKQGDDPGVGVCQTIDFQGDSRFAEVVEYYTVNMCGGAPPSEGYVPNLFCGFDTQTNQKCSKWRIYPAGADDCDEPFYIEVFKGMYNTCAGSECEVYL